MSHEQDEESTERIEQALQAVAEQWGVDLHFGTEDGYTWLELGSDEGNIHPGVFQALSQDIANAAGVDFFFANVNMNVLVGALDWDMENDCKFSDDTPCNIDDYGHRFSPQTPTPAPVKPRKP